MAAEQSCARLELHRICARCAPYTAPSPDFCPTLLLAPLSALIVFVALGIQDTSHLCVIIEALKP